MKKIVSITLVLLVIFSLNITAFAGIENYYLKDSDTDEVLMYTMGNLLNSLNGDMVLWNHFNDSIADGNSIHAIYDDESKSYIGFMDLVNAVNRDEDLIEFTENYNGPQADMPQQVESVKSENGEVVKEEVTIDDNDGEVTGSVKVTPNTPMIGMTKITVTLKGTNSPEDYTVTIKGEPIPYKANDDNFQLAVPSSSDLAKMTKTELEAELVIEDESSQVEFLEVISID